MRLDDVRALLASPEGEITADDQASIARIDARLRGRLQLDAAAATAPELLTNAGQGSERTPIAAPAAAEAGDDRGPCCPPRTPREGSGP